MHSRKLLQSAGRILEKSYGRVDCECVRAFSSSDIRWKAQILDGRKISQQIISELREEITAWQQNGRKRPHLSVILVGNDAGSQSYVGMKMRAAKKAGISSETMRLPDTVSQPDLLSLIESLNNSRSTDGILVQLPLPSHISERAVCDAVSPEKDVDGFHVNNMGNMCQGKEGLYPCTPLGIMELLRRSVFLVCVGKGCDGIPILGIQTFGKNAVVVGRSKNVGMPIAMLMHADGYGDATTTICHRYTPPETLKAMTRMADILIVAVGRPNLITGDMVKEGATVVDVGITRRFDTEKNDFVLKGDVDFESVSEKVAFISPVPGGVGPMTVCMLMKNTFTAARKVRGYDTVPSSLVASTNSESLPIASLTSTPLMDKIKKIFDLKINS